ncbi:hypothetical protein M3Y94_01116500 [Aphelenchoides besseyi]|nr:hypothetical protein M3Y94_01116500 [Aphelenchoides besseyi]KAI6219213.1 Major sperm protein [Aphelenchoides besseyi]
MTAPANVQRPGTPTSHSSIPTSVQVPPATGKDESGKQEVLIVGSSPDVELLLRPRWIVFSAEDGYRRTQYATFMITNTEECVVAFRIRTRDRSFPMFSHCHGFLEPLQTLEVNCILPSVDQWPRDPVEYAGRRHKVVVESLILPDDTEKPLDGPTREIFCRKIFHNTASKMPLTRIYLKLNLLLPRIPDDIAMLETKQTQPPIFPQL